MKIAFINGSPKVKDSASGSILQELRPLLEQGGNIISEYHFLKSQLITKDIEGLTECDVLIFAFPLYVDGIPSHLLNCLMQLEKIFANIDNKDIKVYSLVNCGFYEGLQNKLAIEIMENWCAKAGLTWGQGMGIGAGAMLPSIKNVQLGHGPKKNFGKALELLASNILKGASEDNIFTTPNFPRFLYIFIGHKSWRKQIKENGLKKKDLFTRR